MERLAAVGLKRVDDMTREELIDAMNHFWRLTMMLHRSNMGKAPLLTMPERTPAELQNMQNKLETWFYGDLHAT